MIIYLIQNKTDNTINIQISPGYTNWVTNTYNRKEDFTLYKYQEMENFIKELKAHKNIDNDIEQGLDKKMYSNLTGIPIKNPRHLERLFTQIQLYSLIDNNGDMRVNPMLFNSIAMQGTQPSRLEMKLAIKNLAINTDLLPMDKFRKVHKIFFEMSTIGFFRGFRKTKVDKDEPWILEQVLQHAKNGNNRSRAACVELGWLTKDGQLNRENKDEIPDEVITAYDELIIKDDLLAVAKNLQKK